MISTASSTLKAFTSSRPRRFSSTMALVDFYAGRGRRVVELGGSRHVSLHLLGDLVAGVDRLYRAHGHAHRAVDAFVGVDHEVVVGVVDAVDRTRPDAGRVLRADAGFGYDVGHQDPL